MTDANLNHAVQPGGSVSGATLTRRGFVAGASALFARPLDAFAESAACVAAPVAGVNIAGGEFNPRSHKIGVDYRYPDPQELIVFARRGFRLFRIPFLAARLFEGPERAPVAREPDLGYLVRLADSAAAFGVVVVLDMHDYGKNRFGAAIREANSAADFVACWGVLADRFLGRPHVAFGLMNEPCVQSPTEWAQAANAAIAEIRASGAANTILASGAHWSTASKWNSSGNAGAMRRLYDPIQRMLIEVHQYLDVDASGTHPSVVKGSGGTRLETFTRWARQTGHRAFLGEFGWVDTPEAHSEGRELLAFVHRNADVWAGWAAWAAGKWWGAYPMSLEPRGGAENPILGEMAAFAHQGAACGGNAPSLSALGF